MTTPSPRRAAHLSALEGVRALAALATVTYHLWQNGGRVVHGREHHAFDGTHAGAALVQCLLAGVPVYFALSGFLLARPFLVAALRQERPPDLRNWARRRGCRILPLYWLLVVGVWSSRNFRWPGNWRDLLEHLTFTQDLDGKRIFFTIGPAWSMASEVKFYVLLAALGWLWTRLSGRVHSPRLRLVALAVPIATLYACSMAFKWWAFDYRGISRFQYQWSFSFPARLDGFCVGMAIALWWAHRDVRDRPDWRRLSGLWVVPSAGVLFAAGWCKAGGSGDVWLNPVMSLAVAPVLMTLIVSPGTWVSRALSWAPLVRLGTMSYSLYLVHEPILQQLATWGWVDGRQPHFFAQLALLTVVSLLATCVCFYGVEQPGLQLLNLWHRGRPREYYPHLVAQDVTGPAVPQVVGA